MFSLCRGTLFGVQKSPLAAGPTQRTVFFRYFIGRPSSIYYIQINLRYLTLLALFIYHPLRDAKYKTITCFPVSNCYVPGSVPETGVTAVPWRISFGWKVHWIGSVILVYVLYYYVITKESQCAPKYYCSQLLITIIWIYHNYCVISFPITCWFPIL